AGGVRGRRVAPRGDRRDRGRAGLHVRLGALRREHRPGHWHEDLRGLRAAQGTPGEVRVRARADRGYRPRAARPTMSGARAWIVALLSCSALPQTAHAAQDLQQHLEELKKQYEETAP